MRAWQKALDTLLILATLCLGLWVIWQTQSPQTKISNREIGAQSRLVNFFARVADSQSDFLIRDSVAGMLHKPRSVRKFDWPEHPSGKIVLTTNNLGFRNDEDYSEKERAGRRLVLFSGDSHLDGVTYNSETLPTTLARLLSGREPGETPVMLNGGHGGYGPANYGPFLRRFLYLKPQIYVVVMNIGNDLLDGAMILDAGKEGPRTSEYLRRLQQAYDFYGPPVHQAFNQIFFFKHHPDRVAEVVKFTVAQFIEIQKICTDRGIEFLLVLLPTKADVEWESDSKNLSRLVEILDFTPSDLEFNQKWSRDLALELQRQGVRVWDSLSALKESRGRLYWKKDYHLSHNGHRVLAEAMSKEFQPLLTGR